MKHFFRYHFPFYFWLAAIFIQSSFPSPEFIPPTLLSMDKLAHIIVFGLLAVFCYVSLINQSSKNFLTSRPLLWTFIICSVYGIVDEIHQNFVENRYAELSDWIADILGIVIAISLIRFVLSHRFKLFIPVR